MVIQKKNSIKIERIKYQFKGYARSQSPISSLAVFISTSNQGPNLAMILAKSENGLIVRNEKFVVSYIENGLVGLNASKKAHRDSTCLITRLKEQNDLLRSSSRRRSPIIVGSTEGADA